MKEMYLQSEATLYPRLVSYLESRMWVLWLFRED
jgi:hypothetical protein